VPRFGLRTSSLETRCGPKSLSPTLDVRKVPVHVFSASVWHPPDCQPSAVARVVYILWKVRGHTSRFLVPTDYHSVLSTVQLEQDQGTPKTGDAER
jgi:hypothetical protein